jgi:hypothetical protein
VGRSSNLIVRWLDEEKGPYGPFSVYIIAHSFIPLSIIASWISFRSFPWSAQDMVWAITQMHAAVDIKHPVFTNLNFDVEPIIFAPLQSHLFCIDRMGFLAPGWLV